MKGAAPGPWGLMRMSGNVGSVTRDRYDELVKLGRDWVATMSGAQWRINLDLQQHRPGTNAPPAASDPSPASSAKPPSPPSPPSPTP
jgi:hypothetical protein